MQKIKIIVVCATFFSYPSHNALVFLMPTHDGSTIVVKHTDLDGLTPVSVDNKQIGINIIQESIEVDEPLADDLRSLASKKVEMVALKDANTRSIDPTLPTMLVGMKIAELHDQYFIFSLEEGYQYEAYIIPEDVYMRVLEQRLDPSLDEAAVMAGDERIELPKIPLPPVVTRGIVAVAMCLFYAYHYVKDSCLIFYDHMKQVVQRADE